MRTEQKNHFIYEPASARSLIVGRVLSQLHRRLRGQIIYEQDLTTFSSMHILIEAFNNTLKEGEKVRAFFLSGDKACGVDIQRGEVSSIPMNSYYRRYDVAGSEDYDDYNDDY